MKLLKFFFLLIFLIIIGSILVAGYFGFIPGLSTVMGANKPKDLGVKYTKADYDAFSNKTNGDIVPITTPVDAAHSISYEGKIDVNKDFSQQEISARLNYGQWKYMPVTNTQLRINPDGTVEFSANIMISRLSGFIAREGAGQWTMADVTKGLDFIKMVKIDLPVYMKFQAAVTNNNLSGAIESIQVGRFNVPLATVKADETANAIFQAIISKVPNFYAKSVTFSNGQMHYKGTIPAKMMVEVNR